MNNPSSPSSNTTRVRAGVTGHHVRTVLIVSLALVVAIAIWKP